MKFHGRKRHLCVDIVWLNRQSTIQDRFFFTIAPENSVTDRNLLQHKKVARIEINRALKVSRGLVPASLTPFDIALQLEYPGIIGQGLGGNFQFYQSPVVIEISSIKISRAFEVGFACIGTEAKGRVDSCFR